MLIFGFMPPFLGVFILGENLRFLVDWFSFTVARSDFFSEAADEQFIFDRILGKFMLRGLDYKEHRARYGYNVAYMAAGVTICFGGRDDIFIDLSGSGCRAFESLHPDLNWEKWIGYLRMNYETLHVSRLDVACDAFGILDISKIQSYTMQHKFISKWRRYGCHVGSHENWVMFGSPSSDFRCRIYDKTEERRVKVGQGVDVPEQWVRTEFQLRNQSAESFLRSWRERADLSAVFLGMLRNQLVFYSKYDGIHTDRVVVVAWWRRLLGHAGKIKMAYIGGMDYNLEDLQQYVIKQAGSSIRTYLELYGPDRLMSAALGRPLNDRQRDLIGRFQPSGS